MKSETYITDIAHFTLILLKSMEPVIHCWSVHVLAGKIWDFSSCWAPNRVDIVRYLDVKPPLNFNGFSRADLSFDRQ